MFDTSKPIGMTTDQFAAAIGSKPASIRVRLCKTGSYFGLRPRKLPNGRLMWPRDGPEQLLILDRRNTGGEV